MNVCQYVLALSLLLLAAALASRGYGKGRALDLEEIRRQVEKLERSQNQEGSNCRDSTKVDDFMEVDFVGDPSPDITPDSTLEEVNQKLGEIREQFCRDNPNAELVAVNDYALSVLESAGYFLKNDPLSMVDEAIDNEYYEFPKSLHPTTTMPWSDDNLALLQAKAFGRPEWMSREEWIKYSKDEDVDWKLRFRSLIKSKNKNVYKNEEFRKLIFKNEIFRKNFRGIIQEAYDSGNTVFLSVVPCPSEEFPLEKSDAIFFWSLAYRQDWCSEEWGDHIKEFEDIHGALPSFNVFKCDNPKVFEHGQVGRFLRVYDIKETLETAIEFDSPPFARYLKEKLGEKKFKRMAQACSKVHTKDSRGFRLQPYETFKWGGKKRLSRAYNVLLESGRDLKRDIDIIQFPDVSILNVKHLQPLLDSGFDKVPSSQSDFNSYGSTKTSVEFLKMIMKGEYTVNGKTWKEWDVWKEWEGRNGEKFETWGEAWSTVLSKVRPDILDIELFKLISDHLGTFAASENLAIDDGAKIWLRQGGNLCFYRVWIEMAIFKDDIKFLTEAISIIAANNGNGLTSDSILSNKSIVTTNQFCYEAGKGNLAILDWIFKANPTLLDKFNWIVFSYTLISSPPLFPLLKHLLKKLKEEKLPSYKVLAGYIHGYFSEDFDSYKEVCGIDGVTEAMNEHGLEIPGFPVKA